MERDMRNEFGHFCRNCFNEKYNLNLDSKDCLYFNYPAECKKCGKVRNIVIGVKPLLRPRVYLKIMFKRGVKMAEKDLKKLKRKQLLEMVLEQKEQIANLKQQLSETEKQLKNKLIVGTEAGSIAEASLKLNGVFEAAEAAAAQYIENIKNLSANQTTINQRIEGEAKKKAETIIADAERRSKEREKEAEKKLEEVSSQLQHFYKQKKMLDDFFSDFKDEQNVSK